MKNALSHLFNWKCHPARVFYFAIPLFLIGFGAQGLFAYLQYRIHGDPVYAIIIGIATLVLVVALTPAYKMYRNTQKLHALSQR